jgi:uncharacterized protein (DUF58 family)
MEQASDVMMDRGSMERVVGRINRNEDSTGKGFIQRTLAQMDRPGWKKFASGMFALAVAFLLAEYSNTLAVRGRLGATVFCAATALLLSGYVAVTAVPYLARRTQIEWLRVSIDYKVTREGIVFIAIVFLLSVAGLNTGNNLLYLIVASLLASLLMSGVLSLAVLTGLSLEILLPEHVFARRPAPARIHLENQKRFLPSFSITLAGSGEATESKRPHGRERKAGSSPGKKQSRGQAQKQQPEAAGKTDTGILRQALYFPFLPARRTLSRQVELEFSHRGVYSEKGFSLSTRFPFGFLEKKIEIPVTRELVVYPAVEPTEEFYEILPMISGELEAFDRGRGHDLYSIRDMLPTDSARHLDWKASARAGALKIREFMREDERRLQLIFDRRIGDVQGGGRDKALERFEAAVEFCACLAWHFSEVDAQLQFLSDDFQTRAARADEVIYEILGYLSGVAPSPEQPASPPAGDSAENVFRIVLTGAERGSIPTAAWSRSYVIFFDALKPGGLAGLKTQPGQGRSHEPPVSAAHQGQIL